MLRGKRKKNILGLRRDPPILITFSVELHKDVYSRWTEEQQNLNLPTDIRKDDLGISKVLKIALPNLNDMDLIIKSNRKKFFGHFS